MKIRLLAFGADPLPRPELQIKSAKLKKCDMLTVVPNACVPR